MLLLYKKDNMLYVKVAMDLRLAIPYQNKLFGKGKKEDYLLPDEIEYLLTRNGNIRLWNGNKFVKLNLGQFYDIMKNNNYKVEELVEPKVEEKKMVVKEEVKVVEEKAEVKKEEPVKVEQNQPEVKQEPKKQPEQKKDNANPNHDNKKQRHNNNNNNNKQGGDK